MLCSAVLLVIVPTVASAKNATGRFEVYCDGVGFFLANVDGAPAPGKLLLFLRTDFIPDVTKEERKNVFIYPDGCVPDGKCKALTQGRIRFDNEFTRDSRRVAGTYEIELSGQNIRLASLRQNGASVIGALYEFANEPCVQVDRDFRLLRGGT